MLSGRHGLSPGVQEVGVAGSGGQAARAQQGCEEEEREPGVLWWRNHWFSGGFSVQNLPDYQREPRPTRRETGNPAPARSVYRSDIR
jgi:hypothetical protein